jgi:long-chain acyl-CoA synthetase
MDMLDESSVPTLFEMPPNSSTVDTVFASAERIPDLVVYQVPDGSAWRNLTAAEFADDVLAVAKGLIASGIDSGDRVAVLSATRYEWVLLSYAVWAAGGCTVAVYETSSTDQAGWILGDSATTLLVVETAKHRATVAPVQRELPHLGEILQIDDGAVGELRRRGAALDDAAVHRRRRQITGATPAALIYTSGTTGRPKGACLSHANLYAESRSVRAALREAYGPDSRTLLFLPLAHVFAQAVTVGALDARVVVGHTADWSNLVTAFASFRPTVVFGVPRVFEKIYHGARQRAQDEGRGRIFDFAAATAVAYSEALATGRPGPALRLARAVFDRLVYTKLRTALGGACTCAVSAGAPLSPRLGHFFRGIGVPVYEAYGLTETTAAITVNTPQQQRVGSVGRPLAGQVVKTADDGEVLVRGPVVFEGYWNNPAATADAFDDGWFKTGDLGFVDPDGYVWITGRKKEIIVTAGGKNVSPAQLEDVLRAHPLINQCMVVGDGKPFIGAVITLDTDALPGWLARNAIPADTATAELVEHPALLAEIETAVAEANRQVSKAEGIKKFRILPATWSIAGGELTPKMSLKRATVLQKYAAEVDAIYGG